VSAIEKSTNTAIFLNHFFAPRYWWLQYFLKIAAKMTELGRIMRVEKLCMACES
jgi:hypothetical protein